MRTWRSPIPSRYLWFPVLLSLLSATAALFSSCARSTDPGYPVYIPGRDYIAVDGSFGLLSQCPYGNIRPAERVRGGLWNCPLGSQTIGLTAPPPDLILQADCRKRLLTVRKADRSLDSNWEVKPDGSFDLFFDFVTPVGLSRDQNREGDCQVPATLELSGKLDCADPDRVRYQVDTIWTLDPSLKLPPAAPNSAGLCTLPPGCYLHATTEVQQCS